MKSAALIIVGKNEIQGINKLFKKIPQKIFHEIHYFDGNSTDGSLEFFNSHKNIKVHKNIKKGEIYTYASNVTKANDIVFFAIDGNEDPKDIPILLEKLNNSDMCIASRFLKDSVNEEDGNFLPLRKWANMVFTFLVNVHLKSNISDTINGFRSIKRDLILETNPEVTKIGFDIEFQLTIRAIKLKKIITEIPTIEYPRIDGKTNAKSIPVGLLMLRRFIKEIYFK